jgi:hypothetical protein
VAALSVAILAALGIAQFLRWRFSPIERLRRAAETSSSRSFDGRLTGFAFRPISISGAAAIWLRDSCLR